MVFRRTHIFYIFLCLCSVFCAAPSFAEPYDTQKWNGHIAFEARKGNHRDLGETNLFIPFYQNHNSLAFVDIRGFLDNHSAREGNFGIGYRKIHKNAFMGKDWILGGYGFFDIRHTEYNNRFVQGTFGIEALSEDWDARANIYLPQSTEKDITGTDNVTTVVAGTQLRLQGTNNVRERAMPGFDIEFGYKLPVFEEYVDEIRVLGGGFHFDASGYENVTGPRARFELRWNDLPYYGEGSRFTLGAEAQTDDVRDDTAFLMARLRIPFQTFTNKKSKRKYLSPLEMRMTETIIRDIDIVAGEEKVPRTVDEVATVNVNGTQVSNVVYLDATDNVPVEITNAGAGATIIIDGNAGIIDNGATSIVPLNNQSILGGGVSVMGVSTGLKAPLGTRPTITATNTTHIFNIGTTDNHLIKGIDIDGGNNAFNVNTTTGSTFSDISISNPAAMAFNLANSDNNTLSGITATNVGSNGFVLNTSNNNTITNASVSGGTIGFLATTAANNNTFTNITSVNATQYGVLTVLNNGNSYDNVTAINSALYGVTSALDSNASYSNVTITNAGVGGTFTFNSTNTAFSNVTITDAATVGVTINSGSGQTYNNVTVENAGTDSFSLTNTTAISGTGNLSINPTATDCVTSGAITGSIEVNGGTCP